MKKKPAAFREDVHAPSGPSKSQQDVEKVMKSSEKDNKNEEMVKSPEMDNENEEEHEADKMHMQLVPSLFGKGAKHTAASARFTMQQLRMQRYHPQFSIKAWRRAGRESQ